MALAELLAAAPGERREAFVLTQLLWPPCAEAARAIGCPIGTVCSRVARARGSPLGLLADVDAVSAPRAARPSVRRDRRAEPVAAVPLDPA